MFAWMVDPATVRLTGGIEPRGHPGEGGLAVVGLDRADASEHRSRQAGAGERSLLVKGEHGRRDGARSRCRGGGAPAAEERHDPCPGVCSEERHEENEPSGRGGEPGVAEELLVEALDALDVVVVLVEERQHGAGFALDAVAVASDDLAPLPGAAPLGPPLVEVAAWSAARRAEQTAEEAVGPDEMGEALADREGGSSSRAKKSAAAFKISLARLSSRTSRSRAATRSLSADGGSRTRRPIQYPSS